MMPYQYGTCHREQPYSHGSDASHSILETVKFNIHKPYEITCDNATRRQLRYSHEKYKKTLICKSESMCTNFLFLTLNLQNRLPPPSGDGNNRHHKKCHLYRSFHNNCTKLISAHLPPLTAPVPITKMFRNCSSCPLGIYNRGAPASQSLCASLKASVLANTQRLESSSQYLIFTSLKALRGSLLYTTKKNRRCHPHMHVAKRDRPQMPAKTGNPKIEKQNNQVTFRIGKRRGKLKRKANQKSSWT